jgi:hypothetical protein
MLCAQSREATQSIQATLGTFHISCFFTCPDRCITISTSAATKLTAYKIPNFNSTDFEGAAQAIQVA